MVALSIAVLVGLGAIAVIAGPVGARVSSRKTSAHVKIQDFAFHPATLHVKAGRKIKVTNSDDTTHTFTADNGAFDTGKLAPGKAGTVTVKKPGTYRYHCEIHDYMTGRVEAN